MNYDGFYVGISITTQLKIPDSFKGRRQFKRNCSSLSQNPIFPSHRAFILWSSLGSS
ncbi:hypothetical protein HanXRQr2_Chr13g0614331 [Helianthus annuus]|uniref:Uncharacterized protein n=1 Tax=Helianthus annuus TaxID=4232 RepID=A0A251SXT0_HELAN|nr:hypothetical protein HanXRQr2_Chr13g0614331 [Helianthus annuus]KAJ0851378.1 hypothetical protein HanPSC8_Chr13g0591491 [Helianthus annuus]